MTWLYENHNGARVMLCITKHGAPLSATLPSPSTTLLPILTFIYRLHLLDRKTTNMQKKTKSLFSILKLFELTMIVIVTGNPFSRLLYFGGIYRDTKKNRITETNDHYIAAKRHFELAVPRSAIPPTKWNTFDEVIASKISEDDKGKPWIWLEKIKEHFIKASTLM